jgi:hypothetical protein
VTRAVSVCTAAAIFFVVGCGSSHPSSAKVTVPVTTTATRAVPPPPHLVTQRMIDRFPVTRPQHGLLVWWRAAQFVDYQGYLQSYANDVRQPIRSDPNTRSALPALAGFLTASTLKFLQVARDGPNAVTLYTRILYQAQRPNGKFAVQTLPRVFRMVRQGGTWRLQDDSFAQQVLPPDLRRGAHPKG